MTHELLYFLNTLLSITQISYGKHYLGESLKVADSAKMTYLPVSPFHGLE